MPTRKLKVAGRRAVQVHKRHTTDGSKFFTPAQSAARWGFHPESVRRLLRKGQIESVILGRRRLIPVSEIERIESEGRVARNS